MNIYHLNQIIYSFKLISKFTSLYPLFDYSIITNLKINPQILIVFYGGYLRFWFIDTFTLEFSHSIWSVSKSLNLNLLNPSVYSIELVKLPFKKISFFVAIVRLTPHYVDRCQDQRSCGRIYTLLYQNKVYKNSKLQVWWNLKNILDAQITIFFICS